MLYEIHLVQISGSPKSWMNMTIFNELPLSQWAPFLLVWAGLVIGAAVFLGILVNTSMTKNKLTDKIKMILFVNLCLS